MAAGGVNLNCYIIDNQDMTFVVDLGCISWPGSDSCSNKGSPAKTNLAETALTFAIMRISSVPPESNNN